MLQFLRTPIAKFAKQCDMSLCPQAWRKLARGKPAIVTVLDWILHHQFIAIRSRMQEDGAGTWDALNSDDMRDFDKRVYRAFVLAFTSTAQRLSTLPGQLTDKLYSAMEWETGDEYDCLARVMLQKQSHGARTKRQCIRLYAGTHKTRALCYDRKCAGTRAIHKMLPAYLQTIAITA